MAIFDELLLQMEGATNTLFPQTEARANGHMVSETRSMDHLEARTNDHMVSEARSNGSMDHIGSEVRTNGITEPKGKRRYPHVKSDSHLGVGPGFGSGVRTREEFEVTMRRVQSSDVPKLRPSSSASMNKGEEPDVHPPRAASVETEIVFATLPKKKRKGRGKWSGIKGMSPLFKTRRKSFTNAGSARSSAHVSVTRPSPSVPVSVTAGEKELTPQPPAQATPPEERGSHDVQLPRTTVLGVRSLVALEGAGKGRVGVAERGNRRRSSSAPRDECLNALKVMTTLSSNKECLDSLISYICLPKCVSK